jgi:hypothetical protein
MPRKKYVGARFVKRAGTGVKAAVPPRLVKETFNPDWGARPDLMATALYYANKKRKRRIGLSNLVLGSIFNYDASELDLDDGAPVTALDNLSSDSPPRFNARGRFGLGTITFDGISNYLIGNFTTTLSKFSFFIVANANAHEVRAGMLEIAGLTGNASTGVDGIVLADHGDVPTVNNIRTRKGATGVPNALQLVTPVPLSTILYEVHADLLQEGQAIVDGIITDTDTTTIGDVVNPTKVILGARIIDENPSPDFSDYTFCQAILFDKLLSTDDAELLRDFLIHKWKLNILFLAASWDYEIYELKRQVIGIGNSSCLHTATIYQPDYQGVYHPFVENETVWKGFRYVENDILQTNALDNSIWVLAGALLPVSESDNWWKLENDSLSTIFSITQTFIATSARIIASCYFGESNHSRNCQISLRNLTQNSFLSSFQIPIAVRDANPNARYSGTQDDTEFGGWNVGDTLQITFTGASANAAPGDYTYIKFPQIEQVSDDNILPGEYIESIDIPGKAYFADKNGNTVSEDNVVTEGIGPILNPAPKMVYQKPATSYSKNGNNLTADSWNVTGEGNVSFGRPGLGSDLLASYIEDTGNSEYFIIKTPYLFSNNVAIQVRFFIEKDDDESRFPFIDLFSASKHVGVFLNTKTGAIIPRNGQEPDYYKVVDGGNSWIVIVGHDFGDTGSKGYRIFPAGATNWDGNISTSAVGSCIVDNTEIYKQFSVKALETLGPIFTLDDPASTDEIITTYDAANASNTGANRYEMTVEVLGDADILTIGGEPMLSVVGDDIILSDGTNTLSLPATEGDHSVRVDYSDTTMTLTVDDITSVVTAHDGSFGDGDIVVGNTLDTLSRTRL